MSIFDRYIGQDGIYRRSIQRSDCTRKGGDGFLPLKRYVEGTYGAQWLPQRLWVERQLAQGSFTGRKKLTKGNNVSAGSAKIGGNDLGQSTSRRALIYLPERVIQAVWKMVRDAGFEPATSCV